MNVLGGGGGLYRPCSYGAMIEHHKHHSVSHDRRAVNKYH